jgi:ATP/maltotriose-dependent transcriptional regulator MalT
MQAHAERVGSARGAASGPYLLSHLEHDHGAFDAAATLLETSRTRAAEAGDTLLFALSTGNLAYVVLDQGDVDGAKPLFEEVLEIERRMGNRHHMAASHVTLGRIALYQGQIERATTLLNDGLMLANQVGSKLDAADALRILGDAARRSGDLDQADRSCRQGLRIAWSIPDPMVVIASLEVLVAIAADRGDWERAARLCGVAKQQREQFNVSMQPVDRPAYERLLDRRRGGMTESAFERLQSEGQAMPLDAAVAYALEPPAIVVPAPAARAIFPAGLTPREVDVLRLVAQGLTDAEVAERLVMARRTVNTHLTSIYTKLGVSSRAAATRFAVEQGLA